MFSQSADRRPEIIKFKLIRSFGVFWSKSALFGAFFKHSKPKNKKSPEMKFRGCILFLEGEASHVLEGRRGRAEAQEHAGDIPGCRGMKFERTQKY